MQRYDSYKDSGVKWLGEIPSHWEVCKVKNLCVEIFSGGTPSSGETKYWDGNIPWIPSGMCHDCDIECAPKYITELGYRNSSTRFIPSGTTVMAMTGATCSMVGFLNFESCANQSVTAFVSHKRLLKSRYLFFLLQAMRKYILTFQTGGAQGGINVNDCKNLIIPRIPAEEQEAIANYLDAATSQIDEAISQQQKMIDLLNERKQIIINNAVTKGLDPNVKMKPSGIDWIGDIPEHWNTSSLKNSAKIILGKMLSNEPKNKFKYICAKDVHYGKIETTNLKEMNFSEEERKLYKVNKGDMLIVEGGAGAGGCAIIKEDKENIYIQNSIMIIRGADNLLNDYICFYMQSINEKGYIEYICNKATIPHFTKEKVGAVTIPLPPLKEQIEIVEYINIGVNPINMLIQNYLHQISLLQERKQIIINDVVTGKVKVV